MQPSTNRNKITWTPANAQILLSSDIPDEWDQSDDWQRLLSNSSNLYTLYASPIWFQTVKNLFPDKFFIGAIKAADGHIKSFVPLTLENKILAFSIRNILISRHNLFCAHVMSSEPLGTGTSKEYKHLFETLLQNNKKLDGICFKCIQNDSPFAKELNDIASSSEKIILLNEPVAEDFRYIKLGDSFEEYLTKFNKKIRYNLKRQLRMLLEASDNNLEIERITHKEQITSFIDSAQQVLSNSWKSSIAEGNDLFTNNNCEMYEALAEQGLFRSYILWGNNKPAAFVVGYQHQDVYHYSNVAYDKRISKLSPGTVLFYLLMEDLFEFNKPNILNFGVGDAHYKRKFGTDSFKYSSVIMLRKRLGTVYIVRLFKLLSSVKHILSHLISYQPK